MSPSPLSPAVSRFAALGLTLAVILLVGGLALEPALRRIVGLGDGIEAKREHLGRLMLLATRAPDASQSQRMAARLLADAYLEGGTEAVQFANLQAAVGRVAEAAGVRLRSTQTLPVTQRDDLAFPGLQSTVQVPIEACDVCSSASRHIVPCCWSTRSKSRR